MPAELETAKAAISSVRKGWSRYLAVLWTINLVLAIDFLTGKQFLYGAAEIEFANFKVPRIAFSLTYTLLFGVFILWTSASTRFLQTLICDELNAEQRQAVSRLPEVRLWLLSPISPSIMNRVAFALLTIEGFMLLTIIGAIHVLRIQMPDSTLMHPRVYQGIGFICMLIIMFTLYALVQWVCPGFYSVRKGLSNFTNAGAHTHNTN
ncbi:MAG: hypothetical protein R3A44_01495 [Caldilineaceae bacterium]